MRHPKMIDAFYGKRVVDLAVGPLHCLAVTEEGELFTWGRNEHGQLGDTTPGMAQAEPILLPTLDSKGLARVAAGPAQVWGAMGWQTEGDDRNWPATFFSICGHCWVVL